MATLEIIVKLVSFLSTYNLHFFLINVVGIEKSNCQQIGVNLHMYRIHAIELEFEILVYG